MAQPPPPGVSNISSTGGRTAIKDSPVAKEAASQEQMNADAASRRRRGSKRKPGEDVLVAPSTGTRIAGGTAPPGTGLIDRDIVEMPLPTARKGHKRVATVESVDGGTYSFRTHDGKGKALPHREMQCLFLAIREWRLGGDPFSVFDAFKLKIRDINDHAVYPVPNMTVPDIASVEDASDVLDRGFSLAED